MKTLSAARAKQSPGPPAVFDWEVIADPKKTYIFTLQEFPSVSVQVKLVKYGKRGVCLEVTGRDAQLIVRPQFANQIMIDSDN